MNSRFVACAALSFVMLGGAFAQTKNADSAAARLQKVEDRQAIEQLLMGDYPRALDSNDWAAYAALFAKDGRLIMGGGATKLTGPMSIREVLQLAADPRSRGLPSSVAMPGSRRRTQERARCHQPDPPDRWRHRYGPGLLADHRYQGLQVCRGGRRSL